MTRAVVSSLVLLSLWTCLSARPLIAASASAPAARSEMDIDDLCQHWVHATEEEQPGGAERIFRPAAYRAFPPSRFRMAYKFARNGDCE